MLEAFFPEQRYRFAEIKLHNVWHLCSFAGRTAYPYFYSIPGERACARNGLLPDYLAVRQIARNILRHAKLEIHAPHKIRSILQRPSDKLRNGNIIAAGAYGNAYRIALLGVCSRGRGLLQHGAFIYIARLIFVNRYFKASKLRYAYGFLKLFVGNGRNYVFRGCREALVFTY